MSGTGGAFPALLSIGELHFDCAWYREPHCHADYDELIFLMQGQIRVLTQGQEVRGAAGHALLYPQAVVHEEWATGGEPIVMYCLAWRRGADSERREEPWPLHSPDRQGRLILLLQWMTELFPARSPHDAATLNGLLQALLSEYQRGEPHPHEGMAASVKQYVRDHLAEPLSLSNLANVACMSRCHFAHRFREVAGIAPLTWVRQTRVEAARTLLLTSDLPLRAIAASVGFRDEFHLSRVFRQATGQPPGRVRIHTGTRG